MIDFDFQWPWSASVEKLITIFITDLDECWMDIKNVTTDRHPVADWTVTSSWHLAEPQATAIMRMPATVIDGFTPLKKYGWID